MQDKYNQQPILLLSLTIVFPSFFLSGDGSVEIKEVEMLSHRGLARLWGDNVC